MRKTKEIVICSMFTAFIAISSLISIPFVGGVPITLQTFAVALTGFVLGWKKGLASTLVYILLGAVGIPIFSNFGAGFGVLFGMTGGFLFGFLFLSFFCGLSVKCKHKWTAVLVGLLGLLICYVLGVAQFVFISSMTLLSSIVLFSTMYLPKDIVSIIVAIILSPLIKKMLVAAHFKSPTQ